MAPANTASPLKPLSANSANIPPPALTPSKKVTALKAELEKKDAEIEELCNVARDLSTLVAALEMYYGKKRQDMPMELLDAHLTVQAENVALRNSIAELIDARLTLQAALERVDAEMQKGKKKKKAKKDP